MATNRKPKGISQKTKFNVNDGACRLEAANHVGVREFDRLISEAARLAKGMESWLRKNDVPEDTQTIIHLGLVATSDHHDGSDLVDLLTQLRGMHWALSTGTEFIEAFTRSECFPKFQAVRRNQ